MGTGYSNVLSHGITLLFVGITVASSAATTTASSSSASASVPDTMSISPRESLTCIETIRKGEAMETRLVKATNIGNYVPKEPDPGDGRILMDPCSELASAKLKLSWDASPLAGLTSYVPAASSGHLTGQGLPGVEIVLCIRQFAKFDDHTICYNLTSSHLENNASMQCWMSFILQPHRMIINSYVKMAIQKRAVYLFGQMPPFNGKDPVESCRWICDTGPSIMSIYRCNTSGTAVVNSNMKVVSVNLRDSLNITNILQYTVKNDTLVEFQLKQNLSGTFHFLIVTQHKGSQFLCAYKKTIRIICGATSPPLHVPSVVGDEDEEGIPFWLFSLVSCLVIGIVALVSIIVCVHMIGPVKRRCGAGTGRRRRRNSKQSSRKTRKKSSKNGTVTTDRVAGRLSGQGRPSCYSVIELDPTEYTGARQRLLPESPNGRTGANQTDIPETPEPPTVDRQTYFPDISEQPIRTEHSLTSNTSIGDTRPKVIPEASFNELNPVISVLLVPLPVNERNKELTNLLKSALLLKGNLYIQCIYDSSVYLAMSEDKYGWMTETASDKNKVILFLCFEPPGDIAPETLVGNELLKHSLLQGAPTVFIGHTGCVDQYAGSRDTADHVYDLREDQEYGQLLTELLAEPGLHSDTRFQFGFNSLSAVLNSDASKLFQRKASMYGQL